MCLTQQELMKGNNEIAEYYGKINEMWEKINIDDKNISTILKNMQENFRISSKDRSLEAEIVAWSGMMKYMNKEPSDIESAQKIYNAFAKSSCSNAVKVYANDAGKYFKLTE